MARARSGKACGRRIAPRGAGNDPFHFGHRSRQALENAGAAKKTNPDFSLNEPISKVSEASPKPATTARNDRGANSREAVESIFLFPARLHGYF
jgi:hypothetical protein